MKEIKMLSQKVKQYIETGDYENANRLICQAMMGYPHAAEPHNLMGILMESQGDHTAAMNHLRAAWALDPTYQPARLNLESLGTFQRRTHFVYSEPEEDKGTCILTHNNPPSNMHLLA